MDGVDGRPQVPPSAVFCEKSDQGPFHQPAVVARLPPVSSMLRDASNVQQSMPAQSRKYIPCLEILAQPIRVHGHAI